MGCDIHTFIEFSDFVGQDGEPHWQCFGGQINTGRDYKMFGLLAGVRGGEAIYDPRGLPGGEMSYQVNDYMRIRIGTQEEVDNSYEGGVTTLEIARSWTTGHYGEKIINNHKGEPGWVTNPDLHSHSWLTLGELRNVMARYVCGHAAEDLPDVAESDRLPVMQAAAALQGLQDRYSAEWDAVLATMQAFADRGCQTRLIFCFDN